MQACRQNFVEMRSARHSLKAEEVWEKVQASIPFEPGGLFFKMNTRRGPLASYVQTPRLWMAFLLDEGAGLLIFLDFMWTPDSLIALATSVAAVLIYAKYCPYLAVNMTWTAVSFILLFPLQSAVTEAYRRREAALASVLTFRATMTNIFLGHAIWDFSGDSWWGRREDNKPRDQGGGGMKKKPYAETPLHPDHTERVRHLLLRIADAMEELLLVPRRGRARMDMCPCSHRERDQVITAEMMGRDKVLQLLGRLHNAVEELKAAGMPGNEAARLNQYNYFLTTEFEKLWGFKTYRTLTAFRAFSRVTIFILPFFYAPYFIWIAGLQNPETASPERLVFAVCFASLISMLFAAILNLAVTLENPFRPGARDTVRVREEMDLCRRAINKANADHEETWFENLEFEWEVVAVTPPRSRE